LESKASGLNLERLKKIKKPKKEQLVIFLLFGILLLVISIPTEPKTKDERVEDLYGEQDMTETGRIGRGKTDGTDSYERQQELRLKEVLQLVEGVGKAEVMITLQTSAEKVVEKDTPTTRQTIEEADSGGGSRTTQEESWSEETIYQEAEDGSRMPYVVKQLEPKVEGVIVIAEGGGNSQVKQNILEAVQALFPVEAHKIKIMKMEGSK